MMFHHRQILFSSLKLTKIFVATLQRYPAHFYGKVTFGNIIGFPHVGSHFCKLRVLESFQSVEFVKSFCTGSQCIVPNSDVQSVLSMVSHPSNNSEERQAITATNEVVANIELLHELGMTKEDIAKCEMMHKGFLNSTGMESHVEFLKGAGLGPEEICNIMHRVPRFFTSSPAVVENIVQYMFGAGLSQKNVKNLLIFSPSLFYRVKGRPQKVGGFLQEVIQEHQPNADFSSMLAYMLRDDIKLFNRTEKELRRNLQFLIQLGFKGPDLVKIIRYCPSALRIGTDFLQERWNYLQQKLELNDEETNECIIRLPRILTIADDKLREKFAFFYGEGNFKPDDILRNQRVFERSLGHLERRCQILRELNYQGDFIPMLVINGKVFDARIEKLRALKAQSMERSESENEKESLP